MNEFNSCFWPWVCVTQICNA